MAEPPKYNVSTYIYIFLQRTKLQGYFYLCVAGIVIIFIVSAHRFWIMAGQQSIAWQASVLYAHVMHSVFTV